MRWFDAHLDLACLGLCGRSMELDSSHAGGPWLPAGLTLASLRDGGVGACLGTIFTEVDGTDAPVAYPAGDAHAAHDAGVRQLETYESWASRGWIDLRAPGQTPLRLIILMEGADPIRDASEMGWWAARGVGVVGMAWARGTRYAGGNTETRGLTPEGRALAAEIDRLGLVHDLSHLSDAACDELLACARGRMIASHSNCRALLGGTNQRHLGDATIAAIGKRGGVIGINLFSRFLRDGVDEAGRASIDDVVRHVEHVCAVMGHRGGVGLGSDMDGGFSAARLPKGIDRPADYARLGEALAARGWSDAEVEAFAWGNWARFFGVDAEASPTPPTVSPGCTRSS